MIIMLFKEAKLGKTMKDISILGPIFGLVGLSFIVWLLLFKTRLAEANSRRFKPADVATRRVALASYKSSARVSDHYQNLFEMPVLFITLCLLAYQTHTSDMILLVITWMYVGCRAAHAIIHLTSNNLIRRMASFLVGSTLLWIGWALVAWRLFGETTT